MMFRALANKVTGIRCGVAIRSGRPEGIVKSRNSGCPWLQLLLTFFVAVELDGWALLSFYG